MRGHRAPLYRCEHLTRSMRSKPENRPAERDERLVRPVDAGDVGQSAHQGACAPADEDAHGAAENSDEHPHQRAAHRPDEADVDGRNAARLTRGRAGPRPTPCHAMPYRLGRQRGIARRQRRQTHPSRLRRPVIVVGFLVTRTRRTSRRTKEDDGTGGFHNLDVGAVYGRRSAFSAWRSSAIPSGSPSSPLSMLLAAVDDPDQLGFLRVSQHDRACRPDCHEGIAHRLQRLQLQESLQQRVTPTGSRPGRRG